MNEDLRGFRMVHMYPDKGGVLRERRVILGLTQQQVADKAGVRLQQYQAFEGGQRSLMSASFKIACAVLEALDLDFTKYYHKEYVFGEEIYLNNGLRYVKTGKLTSEDVE